MRAAYFLLVLALNSSGGSISPQDVNINVYKGLSTKLNEPDLSDYKRCANERLNTLFPYKNYFDFKQYKALWTSTREKIIGKADIVGPNTPNADHFIIDLSGHKVVMGLILAFVSKHIPNKVSNRKLIELIRKHDLTKLDNIEGYQTLDALFATDPKTAYRIINSNKTSKVYKAMYSHITTEAHHPEYWWKKNQPLSMMPMSNRLEMLADHLSVNVRRGGDTESLKEKLADYRNFLNDQKFAKGKPWEYHPELKTILFNFIDELEKEEALQDKPFGELIGLYKKPPQPIKKGFFTTCFGQPMKPCKG